MFYKPRTRLIAAVMAALAGAMLVSPSAAQQTRPARQPSGHGTPAVPGGEAVASPADNAFANPSFELGRQFWQLSLGGKTAAKFEVANDQAADGQHCGVISLEAVESWGVQFGQAVPAGQQGKTYTFAALARSAGEPVKVTLQIERRAEPYDRAARGQDATLTKDKWTELHVTFKVEKDFKEGWFAYVSCVQPNSRFRLDMLRLYEGPYVPFEQVRRQDGQRAGVCLYDTGQASAGPLEAAAVAGRQGWARLPEDKLDHAFKGDAVFMNNRLAVVLRLKSAGAEVYALDGQAARRAVLSPAGFSKTAISAVKIVENNPGVVSADVTFAAADGKELPIRFELKLGQVFVQASFEKAGEGVRAVRVESPARFGVMPDFFADDIVVDAAQLPIDRAELPSENFLLHLAEGGGAIVMDVWTDRDSDVTVALAGQGQDRRIVAAEIPCANKGKVWVAVLSGPGIWHAREVAKADAGKVIPLDWRPPMPAQWRMDWRRADGDASAAKSALGALAVCDSWEMVIESPKGEFLKYGLVGSPQTIPSDRKRWTTVLGNFLYPCWIDKEGRGQIQPLKSPKLVFDGPALIYPINRVNNTPLEAYTVVDVVRSTLGVGPCEYILDIEGQQSVSKGIATCANRDRLNPIYEKKQQKARRAEIEKSLTDVLVFIRFIRQRIEGYVGFGHDLRAYLAQRKAAQPELAAPISELEALAAAIDQRVEARRKAIKTPDEAAAMIQAFRDKYLDYEGADAFDKCKAFTGAIVEIGSNQDELAGECRWAVKMLRQRAGLALATRPELADIAREIRARSQKILRSPAGHEAARH